MVEGMWFSCMKSRSKRWTEKNVTFGGVVDD